MWGKNWGTMMWSSPSAAAAPTLGWIAMLLIVAVLACVAFWQIRRGRRWAARVLLLLPFLVPGAVNALSLPFVFTNGTPADATEVNANFEALSEGVNALEGSGNLITTTFDMNSFVDITPVGTRVPVSSFTLPPGNHLVTATLDAVVDGSGLCELVRSGSVTKLDVRNFSATLTPNFKPQQEILATFPVTLQAHVALGAEETVTLQCAASSTPTFSKLALQVRAARMTAHSVASLTVVP